MTTSRTSRWMRYRRSEEGAASVEFAMVFFPFIFVLGCICETGVMLFTEYVIQNSVQEAGRLVRTGQVTKSDGSLIMTDTEFKAKICDSGSAIPDCVKKLRIYVDNRSNFSDLSSAAPDPIEVGPLEAGETYDREWTFSPGGASRAVTVIATYDWGFAFPFMSFLGNIREGKARRLYGIATFRNEPF
ncbi:TadE/TadG family type IV pilus assembly protein [Aestuariivirga sp.]|uniref:TadE/TadG family type IV pilus assembly protein n=1 Tax=Aestuariivirga sp. TaxID=2650926 RepID=UPI00391A56FB